MKLKNSKLTFTDESRYDLFTPIHTGQEKVDQTIAQFFDILNEIKTALGKLISLSTYSEIMLLEVVNFFTS